MSPKAFQDDYPDHVSHCYGCGRLNEHGLPIKSYWAGGEADSDTAVGDEAICTFTPRACHPAIPGYVCGGRRRNGRSNTTAPLEPLDRGSTLILALTPQTA